jgi:hypothetical protein
MNSQNSPAVCHRNFSCIEPLEARIAPAVLIVSTLKDITDPAHDTGSLRDAIFNANAAVGDDSIIFQTTLHGHVVPLHGAIVLKSDLPAITDGLTINGPTVGKANGIIINGNQHEIFSITSGDVTLTDLTVMHGRSQYGGGLFIDDAGHTVQLTDVTVRGNHAIATNAGDTSYGGGIDIAAGTVTIASSKISGNVCTGAKGDATHAGGNAYGGGIISRGTLTLTDSVVSGNVAKGGNSVAGHGQTGGSAYGGGIYCSQSTGNVTIENSIISGNKSLGGIGGSGAKGMAGISGGNGGAAGFGNGGGVYIFKGTVSVSDSTISGNLAKGGKAGNGGAGGAGAGGGAGGDGRFDYGGGISSYGSGASSTINNSTISGNKIVAGKAGTGGAAGLHGTHGAKGAAGSADGGGVYSGVTLDISGVTIAKNSAQDGGAVFIGNGTASIINSTIAKNNASRDGGGFSIAGGTVTIHNSTIAQNKANAKSGFGGGLDIFNTSTPVEIISTIIAGNTAHSDRDMSSGNNTVDASFTLIQHVTDGTSLNNTSHDNLLNVNPLLGALGNHGGTTQTILPAANSPVIDAGSNPDNLTTDQRGTGFARVLGTADIGAVEVGTFV